MPSNTENKERLIELGFREICYWSKDNNSIYQLDPEWNHFGKSKSKPKS